MGGFYAEGANVGVLLFVEENHSAILDFDGFPVLLFAKAGQHHHATHSAVLVANLNTGVGGHPQIAIGVKFHRTDFELGIIETVQPVERLFIHILTVVHNHLIQAVAALRLLHGKAHVGVIHHVAPRGRHIHHRVGKFPFAIGHEHFAQQIVFGGTRHHVGRPAFPHPFHHFLENEGGASHIVAAVAPVEFGFVASEIQCRGKHLIALVPVAKQRIPSVVGAVLQAHLQRTRLALAHKHRHLVAATHTHKSAHATKHARKQVGTVPCRHECGDTATAQPENHVVFGVARNADRVALAVGEFLHFGQHLLFQKFGEKW